MSQIDEIHILQKIKFLKLPLLILSVTCIFLLPSYSYAQSVPNSPQNLVVTINANQASLSWSAPSNNGGESITGYRIDYSIDSGSFLTLTSNTGNTGTTFTHNNIQTNHNYNYIVYAINSVGVGSPSNIATAAANQGTIPNPPQSLVASVTAPNQITLSWSSPTGTTQVTGYRIDYSIDSGDFIPLVSNTGTTSTTHIHTGVQSGHTYRYIVYAINSVGTSSPSNLASTTVNQQNNVPNPPQNLDAISSSQNEIDLSWGSPSNIAGTGVTGYRIDYSIDSGNFVPLVSNIGTATNYAHTGVSAGHTYRYIVYAMNSAGTSSPSNVASSSVNQQNVPNPPQNLVATVSSSNQVNLSWSLSPDISGAGATGYRIDYSIDSGDFVPLVSNIGPATTYSHTGVQPGHTYRYVVYATNSAGTSSPSNQAYVTIANPTPTISILSGTIPVVNTPATLGYSISGGQVYSASINNDTNTLNFRLQGNLPGVLYLQLPRTLIDAKQPDGSDKNFYVIVDNKNAVFSETRTGSYRALAISFPAGANDVTIIGTLVVGGVNSMGGTVPEFPVALIGLVAGLVPVVFLSRRFVKI